ncbi:ABC transporter substrate-binding protein [Pseudonocardia zijingensis]|jgi:iron complex transport system substrate-binding protein|uniref:Cobalamin-binding protein n=1 Tax=Pseudonocardia zijingensis TaxID=153376 RepID=A0ABN1PWG1_9PSEU
MRLNPTTAPTVLAAAVLLAACGTVAATPATDDGPRDGFPMTISSCGREVTFDEPPGRVVTVGSVAAPLVAAAGAADRIVVRTFETASFPGEYAPELDGVEVVAPTVELAREEIISRIPDLVISYEGAATGADELAGVGIDLLVSRGYCQDAAGDLEDVFADVELYGRLFGTAEAAAAEVASLRQRVAAVGERFPPAATARRAAALILSRDGGGLSAYGATSTVDEQMRILGLANVFSDVPRRNFEVNLETLVAQDPQVLILLTQGDQTPESARQALRQRPELGAVTAIRTGAVIAVPFGYTGPGPVAVEGLEVLADELAALG